MSLLLALLAACTSSTPAPSTDVGQLVAASICTLHQRLDTPCTATGARAEAGGITYAVSAKIGAEATLTNQASVDLDVTVEVAGLPKLRGVIGGMGPTRDAAIERAVNDWGVVWGTAIVDAARDTGRPDLTRTFDLMRPPEVRVIDGRRAYMGYTAVKGMTMRGEPVMPDLLLDGVADRVPAGPRAIAISVTAEGPDRLPECTVDGVYDATLCDRLPDFPLPPGGPMYVLRQVIIFVPVKA